MKSERGFISLIESMLVMTIGVALIIASFSFRTAVEGASNQDACAILVEKNGIDLSNTAFDPSTACP